MEALELFKDYAPIMSIYESEDEYICFPLRDKLEPLAVFYDKKLGQYETMFFYEDADNTIPDAVEGARLVYGKEMEF